MMEVLVHRVTADMALPVRKSSHLPRPTSVCKAVVVHAYNGEVLKIIDQCLMLISISKKVFFTYYLSFLEQIPLSKVSIEKVLILHTH